MTTLVGGVLGITGLIGKGIGAIGGVDQNLQVWGLSHMVGQTIAAFVNGEDTGDVLVAADGSVTIDISSSSHSVTAATLIAGDGDWGESTTPIYIANGAGSVWVDVPIVIGNSFVTQGQRLRPASREDGRSESGPILGMLRRSTDGVMLVRNAVIVRFGTLLDPSPEGNMLQAAFKQEDGVTDIVAGTMFSGVFRVPIQDTYTFDGALCWQIDRPWPCTVVAASQFLVATEPE